MSLANIVSGIVQKESKVDRKKVAYFFKDYDMFKSKEYSLGLLLRVLNPETITILSVQPEVIGEEPDRKVDRIRAMVDVLLPKTKVTSVHGELTEGHDINTLVLDKDSPIAKEQLMITDLGLYFDIRGRIFVYKGDYVPTNASFFIDATDLNSLELLRDADLEKLLPTKNMFMISDLTRNPDAEIMICHFSASRKRDAAKQITEITSAILNSLIKTNIEIAYYSEDFNEWNYGEPTTSFMGHQYDYVLALREGRIDVHLPFDNGHLAKEPNGWLFLN